MPVASWKTVFDVGAVVLLGLTFVFGAGALFTGDILNKRQEKEIAQLKKEAGVAGKEAGQANERAGNLEADNLKLRSQVASLEKSAADAKTEMAKQEERAATAERDAARAKLEFVEFRAPRFIQDEKCFVAEMKAFFGQKFSCAVANDQEATAFLLELQATLASSGWVPIPPQRGQMFINIKGMQDTTGAGLAAVERGIGVYVEYPLHPNKGMVSRARALVSALKKQGVVAQEATSAIAQDTLNILVGEKPDRWKWPRTSPEEKP